MTYVVQLYWNHEWIPYRVVRNYRFGELLKMEWPQPSRIKRMKDGEFLPTVRRMRELGIEPEAMYMEKDRA
jgi:hypothetical protein